MRRKEKWSRECRKGGTNVKTFAGICLAVLLFNVHARCQQTSSPKPPVVSCLTTIQLPNKTPQKPKATVNLQNAAELVEEALNCYQTQVVADDTLKKLPKLASVDLDFKATTGATAGLSLSILVLKFGVSRETDVTDDVTFTYQPHKAEKGGEGFVKEKTSTTTLYSELIKEVEAAAALAAKQKELLGLPLDKIKVMVSYGIKYDGNVSVSFPFQLVTIGGNGDYNKNNTQSITLTFTDNGG